MDINQDVLRQAELRRRRLLVNQEERMRRILLGSKQSNSSLEPTIPSSNSQDSVEKKTEDSSETNACCKPVREPSPLNVPDSSPKATELKFRGDDGSKQEKNTFDSSSPQGSTKGEDFSSHGYTPEIDKVTKEPVCRDAADNLQFPRKVSLISSRMDFKACQQSQCQQNRLLLSSRTALITLSYRLIAIFPVLSLVIFAMLGSFLQYEAYFPFITYKIGSFSWLIYKRRFQFMFFRQIFSYPKLLNILATNSVDLIVYLTFYISTSALFLN